uniref:Uncharacterized protein n=1 Tax=Oryza nivara TaxID=4536 RepID=A0A0E0G3W3_ORYNI
MVGRRCGGGGGDRQIKAWIWWGGGRRRRPLTAAAAPGGGDGGQPDPAGRWLACGGWVRPRRRVAGNGVSGRGAIGCGRRRQAHQRGRIEAVTAAEAREAMTAGATAARAWPVASTVTVDGTTMAASTAEWPAAVGYEEGDEAGWCAVAAQREVRLVEAEPSKAAHVKTGRRGATMRWCPHIDVGLNGGGATVHLW